MPYRSYRELIVWQKSIRLCIATYAVARLLPRTERFELAPQMRRAAISISANIAEGNGRRRRSDYARLLAIARGSARELDTLFEVAAACGLVREGVLHESRTLLEEVAKMLTAMLVRLDPLSPSPNASHL